MFFFSHHFGRTRCPLIHRLTGGGNLEKIMQKNGPVCLSSSNLRVLVSHDNENKPAHATKDRTLVNTSIFQLDQFDDKVRDRII
jgi:hypothetical protein